MRGGEVRAGRQEGLWCGGGTQAACTGPDSRLGGQGHALERTLNMSCMAVTLEVSQPEMSALKFFK